MNNRTDAKRSNRMVPMLKKIGYIILVLFSAECAPSIAFGYDSVLEKECYFIERENGAPIWNDHHCEIVSSVGQGEYFFNIKFNSQRRYIIEGSWNDNSAKLDKRRAIDSHEGEFECWLAKSPYLKICFKDPLN